MQMGTACIAGRARRLGDACLIGDLPEWQIRQQRGRGVAHDGCLYGERRGNGADRIAPPVGCEAGPVPVSGRDIHAARESDHALPLYRMFERVGGPAGGVGHPRGEYAAILRGPGR